MLNISPNNRNRIDEQQFISYQNVKKESSNPKLKRALYIIGSVGLLIMFLPWTQNIRSNGKITTLRPEQRPQTINSIIAGRIESWFGKDGDFVKKGQFVAQLTNTEIIDIQQNYLEVASQNRFLKNEFDFIFT